mgnify:CR=1 FL=1
MGGEVAWCIGSSKKVRKGPDKAAEAKNHHSDCNPTRLARSQSAPKVAGWKHHKQGADILAGHQLSSVRGLHPKANLYRGDDDIDQAVDDLGEVVLDDGVADLLQIGVERKQGAELNERCDD